MKRGFPSQLRAIGLVLASIACVSVSLPLHAQTDPAQTAQLLGKAHALEVRGRIDMAKQIWQQVLLVNPNDPDALAGMARAAKLSGDQKTSAEYLDKLRAINPNDPNIARVETMGTSQDQSSQLQEAGRLAQAGQYAKAMTILRQVYGDNPPAGDAALSYYQTEAAIEEGRPHAIAGLRALIDKYPDDSRYQIALGKILTYNPRTREEGRKLLEKHPNDPDATEALRQSLVWDEQNPATSAAIRSYLAKHKDEQLSTALAANGHRGGGRTAPSLSPEQQAAQAAYRARSAEDQAAYSALSAKHFDDAEAKFKAILANNPKDTQALAGLGYVRMGQSNFGGAISYLEQAEGDGAKDAAVEKALSDSRYYYTMQQATTALNENDLATAQQQFTAAEHMRPTSTDPLLGLGGTLLKGQQAEPAIGVYAQFVKMAPGDKAAWRGLFMAQYGAMKYNDALATDKRVPAKVKVQLLRDPDYLRTLASVYSALGRDADAQRVLRTALDLPFPADAGGLKTDVQSQYAALLSAANRKEQAVGLYKQILAGDPSNTNAYVGLVQNEHQLNNDAEAYQTIQSMPPDVYARAMQDPGFETTAAAIYGAQGHPEMAQGALEKFLASQQSAGKQPFLPAEIQLAGIYLQNGDSAKAYPLYSSILQSNPASVDAWNGLLSTLHATGHDQEALAQLEAMPPAVRAQLENDPAYLQTVGSIYASLGQPQEAMLFYNRVQQHYAAEHMPPPADIDIQEAWLLYNAGNDAGLVRQLLLLGGRQDLSAMQRMTVQTIWTNYAVRRANQASARGDYRRAIAILNATASSFPGNPTVIKALASGYASAGRPKEAVAIFRSQDMNIATASDYKAAIGAALSANDLRDAETWLRFGLVQYPRDPQMLVLAAKFEAARGDANRAAEYYRASLALMPRSDPGAELAGELSRPAPMTPARLPSRQQPQDLTSLLSQPEPAPGAHMAQPPMQTQPYLPSYNGNGGTAPVQLSAPAPAYNFGGDGVGSGVMGSGAMGSPQNNSYPGATPQPAPRAPANTTLRDYTPQSRLELPETTPHTALSFYRSPRHLHVSPAMEAKYGPYVVYDPAHSTPHFVDAAYQLGDGNAAASSFSTASQHLHAAAFEGQQATAADGTPIVSYVPNAAVPAPKPAPKRRITSRPAISAAAARAAEIRANQDAAPEAMTGQSHPPEEKYEATSAYAPQSSGMQTVQFATPQYTGASPTGQTAQPQANGSYSTSQAGTVQQTGDSRGQQYPQPHTGNTTTGTQTATRRRAHKAASTQSTAETTPVAPAPITYPNYAPPLANTGYPQIGAPVPLGQAPSDYELQQRNLPPLRGYYDPRADDHTPLTERQQTELDLATIQGSYSGWIGGSVIGRYRSGTPGIDRLATLEAPFEASVVVNNSIRLSVIPKAVFLNNGQLDAVNASSSVPILGSLYGGGGTGGVNPPQQFASGVGGEFQLATNTFAAAIGFTPYEFLVTNVIGRVQWRPDNGHFTFYGGRDAVRETELSYAGLRDPGSATTTFSGNVWGGVVQTGGGVRFDAGNEKSGIYIQGEGADLSGYHVLDNRKFDGTMGAYFRVKTWPEYGSLNIGGTFFGEHFSHNELGETYGLGGYFSPEAYFLAAVPVTFNGHYGSDFHYVINGAVGIQTFQQDNEDYFPLDPALQTNAVSLCETAAGSTTTIINQTCGQVAASSNTGINFSADAEGSYRVNEHWYVGAFISGNNTNNYNTVSGGFFARYLFRPQYATDAYPTGLFPVEGFRPLRVP